MTNQTNNPPSAPALKHWDHLVAPWLSWIEQHLPDSATKIVAEYPDSLMRMVRDGVLGLAVVYQPQHCPGIVIEPLVNESLILVPTEPRTVASGQVPGYIFVNWGEVFRTKHSLAFPDTPSHRLTVGLGAVGLEHILKHGGSGYFLESMVQDKRLFVVTGAPVFERPLFLVYQQYPANKPLLDMAIFRHAAIISG